MARILRRSPATVSRELRRNSAPAGYASVRAEALSAARRSAGRRPEKLCLQSVCWRVVLTLISDRPDPARFARNAALGPDFRMTNFGADSVRNS
ncbi:helix-turn-helix domain-containing protein [Caballeronia choica]|jgi:IS30 family transposase|uniref:helix-turn-helix domain-containing protein n=1 Tax=Caballeronia choica TaxID=326476 RepID=UPI000B3ED446